MLEKTAARLKYLIDRILEVRYSNLELEREYCEELLDLSHREKHTYGIVFATVYLGDYYVAKNDGVHCAMYLTDGLNLGLQYGYDDLVLMSDILFGIYLEIIGDEHSAVEYHLKGLKLAKRLGDVEAECKLLNNMGHDFQKYHNYPEALRYCSEAFQLIDGRVSEREDEYMLMAIVVGNLVELSIKNGDLDAAGRYCEYFETQRKNYIFDDAFMHKNWCSYYTAAKEYTLAVAHAQKLCEAGGLSIEFGYTIFEIWYYFCSNMIAAGNQEYAEKFLQVVMHHDYEGEPGSAMLVQDLKMRLWLEFGDDAGQEQAYYEYYQNVHEITKKNDRVRVEGLKSQMYLHEVMIEQADMKALKNSLMREANIDELTGLYNRRYFNQLKGQYAARADLERIGFIMLDVDCFKEYNDLYGHINGDRVLRVIAVCLLQYRTPQIVISRFGGDEFICMCIDMTDEMIETFICQVRTQLSDICIAHDNSVFSDRVTLSIGYSNEDVSMNLQTYELFEMADRALYQSKLKGRNTFTKQPYEP